MSTLDTATKTELRILCKAQGVKGYGSLNNEQMRVALRALVEKDPNYETTGTRKAKALGEEQNAVITTAAPAEPADKPKSRSKPKAVTTPVVEQNGVKQPGEGYCRNVWLALDAVRSSGKLPAVSDVVEALVAEGIAKATIRTQFARWRQFHAITRAAKVAPPALRIDGSTDEHVS